MRSWPFFSAGELMCECPHCGGGDMDDTFMEQLVTLRHSWNKPLIVVSAYRCSVHDNAIGGKGNHTLGRAVDLAIPGKDILPFVTKAIEHGFTGIGVKNRGGRTKLHLDNLTSEDSATRPWLWTYD